MSICFLGSVAPEPRLARPLERDVRQTSQAGVIEIDEVYRKGSIVLMISENVYVVGH